MKYGNYIAIISDGSQLFVKDTECFLCLYPDNPDVYVRPTVDQFYDLIKNKGSTADFLGKHIVSDGHESNVRKIPAGTEIWDLEWCGLGEFYFICKNESKILDKDGNEIQFPN